MSDKTKAKMERSDADRLLGFFPLRTVKKNLLKPRHWEFPDFGIFSHEDNKAASEDELAWLETAVAYEYAREFESLALLHQQELRYSTTRLKTDRARLNERKGTLKQKSVFPFDGEGYWQFFGSIDTLSSVLMPNDADEKKKSGFSLVRDQWAVSFDAAPGFPDKPFSLDDYIRSGRSPKATSSAVKLIKRLKPGQRFELLPGSEALPESFYVIAVNWQCSADDLKKYEFPRWVDARIRDENITRISLRGKGATRVQEQALRDLGILRLCCQQRTISKAMKVASASKNVYERRDQWEAACLRCMRLLAQWGLLVKAVARNYTEEQWHKKILPLEVVAFMKVQELDSAQLFTGNNPVAF